MDYSLRRFLSPITASLVVSCALSGCAHIGSGIPQYEALLPDAPRLCDINANPKPYFGKTVVLEGVYESDGANYAYIEDKRCPKYRGILGIGYRVPDRDLSVDLFEKAEKLDCRDDALCITEAHIVVRGVIVKQREPGHLGLGQGSPLIDMKSVLYVRFIDTEH